MNGHTIPFVKTMQTIYGLAYHAPTTKQNRTKYSARTNVFKSVLLVPKIGPYMELKEYIESPVDTHLQSVEAKLLENCETVFSNILHDFEMSALAGGMRRQELRREGMRLAMSSRRPRPLSTLM